MLKSEMQVEIGQPLGSMATTRVSTTFNPVADAKHLRQTFMHSNLRVKEISYILSNRSDSQRQAIREAFQYEFKQALAEMWQQKGALNDKFFRQLAEALITAGGERDAQLLHDSMAGVGTDELKLMEVLYSRSWDQLCAASAAYEAGHKKTLAKRIEDDCSGHFNTLLQRIISKPRETAPANREQAAKDADDIYNAGEGIKGTNEEVFIDLFTSRSYPHLKLVCEIYDSKYSPIEKALIKEMKGDFEKALLFMVDFARNYGLYQAQELVKALSKKSLSNSDKETLIRIIAGHCDTDLKQIDAKFEDLYGESLANAIASKTDGDFRTLLITLV